MTRDPIDHFIDLMGFMTQEDGAPRIAGQILGYLLVEGDPRTLAQITEGLGISKGSASTNCRLLATKGAINRVAVPGSRQDAYQAVSDPGRQTLAGLAARFRERAAMMDDAIKDFPENRQGAFDRASEFARFFRNSADFLDHWTRHHQTINATGPERQE